MESGSQNNFLIAGVEDAEVSDYISMLPDPFICYILSYIPTKSAVATSILSKRWRTVWTRVPALDFSEMPHLVSCCNLGPRETLFQIFVDKVLTCNDGLNMENLRLHFFSGIRSQHASDWLSEIMRRQFREIDLTCHCPNMKLPATFFNREKLVVLKLTCFSLDLPDNTLYCPSLESLHLIHVFLNDLSLEYLIAGCPVLEELVIDSCKGISNICFESYSLITLEIKDTLTGRGNHVIALEAPNLEILYLSDIANKYVLSSPCLEKAVVTVHDLGVTNHTKKLVTLLQRLRSLKHLKLGRATMEVLQTIFLRGQLPLPVFRNLRCLEVTAGMWSMILQMLEFTPILVSLILRNFSSHSQNEWHPPPKVPKCLLSTLQEISMDQLNEDEGEMKMLEYLMQNAVVLKKLEFSKVSNSCPGGNTDVLEKIRDIFSRSRGCEVVLCQSET